MFAACAAALDTILPSYFSGKWVWHINLKTGYILPSYLWTCILKACSLSKVCFALICKANIYHNKTKETLEKNVKQLALNLEPSRDVWDKRWREGKESSVCVRWHIYAAIICPGWRACGLCPYLRPPNYPFALMFIPVYVSHSSLYLHLIKEVLLLIRKTIQLEDGEIHWDKNIFLLDTSPMDYAKWTPIIKIVLMF